MKITLIPDKDDEALDPVDALGTIILCDSKESSIRDECVYFNDWLEALIEGINELQKGRHQAAGDIISEPEQLYFQRQSEEITITYEHATITVENLCILRQAVCDAIIELVLLYQEHPHSSQYQCFRPLIAWLERHQTTHTEEIASS